ncbi:MAG: flippase-like domain-containing protein [Ktedonobacteraceae bacterium]|nr:flippase-like domain-containing protein [Ktedonobacteraceae bacterium]
MQQSDQNNMQMGKRPARLFKHQFISAKEPPQEGRLEEPDVAALPTTVLPTITPHPMNEWDAGLDSDPDADIPLDELDIGSMSTIQLMRLSGMMRAVHPPQSSMPITGTGVMTGGIGNVARNPSRGLSGSFPPELFGETLLLPATRQPKQKQKTQGKMIVRYVLGLLVGIGFLFLVSRFINIASTVSILQKHLTTTQGLLYAAGAAVAFIAAFSIRGVRWSLFLRPIKPISPFKTVRIFWIAVFMNFLLPVQGGEVIKTFLLKRTDGVPISHSLPTVAMDKALDLMPALFLLAVMPFIPGIHMSLVLWLILGFVSSILLGVIFTVLLTAWNRPKAIKFISMMLKLLPRGIGKKIEGFAFGFIDSLLAGASRPKTFIPAIFLTCGALSCDGLFAWMCFRVVGITDMSYGSAIFGYTLFNMFTILPSPPGQLGSNETYGPLVFNQLLGFPKTNVLAMFLFSHPLAAVIMIIMCFICLGSLGLSFASVMKATPDENVKSAPPQTQARKPSQTLQYGRV